MIGLFRYPSNSVTSDAYSFKDVQATYDKQQKLKTNEYSFKYKQDLFDESQVTKKEVDRLSKLKISPKVVPAFTVSRATREEKQIPLLSKFDKDTLIERQLLFSKDINKSICTDRENSYVCINAKTREDLEELRRKRIVQKSFGNR